MRKITPILLVLVLLMSGITGCASVQQVQPETVPQKIMYAYGLIDGVGNTVDTLYMAGVLSDKETVDAARALEKAWDSLSTAERLYAIGEKEKYKVDLNSALEIVTALQEFMLERSKQQ